MREFIDLAGGPDKARIVVFAMASKGELTSGQDKADQLTRLGAHAVNVYVTRAQAKGVPCGSAPG